MYQKVVVVAAHCSRDNEKFLDQALTGNPHGRLLRFVRGLIELFSNIQEPLPDLDYEILRSESFHDLG